MSIRHKLSMVLLLVVLTLIYNASLLITSLVDTQKRVEQLNYSAIELKSLVEVELNIGLQFVEILDYFLGEKDTQDQFKTHVEEVEKAFDIILPIDNSMEAAHHRVKQQKILKFKNQYDEYLKRSESIWLDSQSGNSDTNYDILYNEVRIQEQQEILKLLGEHIDFEIREIDEWFDALLMNLGRFPWFTTEPSHYIRSSKLAYRYFLAAGNVFTDLNELIYHMNLYTLFKRDRNINNMRRSSVRLLDDIAKIKNIIHLQMDYGVKGKEEDLKNMETLNKRIKGIIANSKIIISLVDQGKINEAVALKQRFFHRAYEQDIKEPLLDIIDDGQRDVTAQNDITLEVVSSATRNGVIFFLLLSGLIIHLSFKMLRGMTNSISEIKKGIEHFANGKLGHRIDARGDDELYALSNSFNAMALNLHESHLELANSKQHTHKILHSMNDTLFVVSRENIITSVNNALCRLLEYKEDELLGRHASQIFYENTFGVDRISALSKNDLINNLEVSYKVKSDKKLDILFSSSIVRDDEGAIEYVICAGQDITKRKEMERQLEHDIVHDSLTGLSNRILFMERLEQALRNAKLQDGFLFAVLMMDLDRFKIVNDSLGHIVGDELLTVFPERMKTILRPDDTFARMGGDEFALLLDGISDIRDATRVAERILDSFKKPFLVGKKEIISSVSIGIAQSATGYDNPDDILRDADTAMYEAKALGRARYKMFDNKMHLEAVRILEVESAIRSQLKNLDKEFLVYYQPILSLVDARIIGAEALIRWHRPNTGIVSPVDFIPITEETGMIVPIGEWVLRKACQQVRMWRELTAYPDITVSVNFSARQFQQQYLLDKVTEVINEAGIPPNALDIEITESIAMGDIELTVMTLDKLSEMGLKISLDDFGTGYSSMTYLKRFSINALKIDREFIKDIPKDSDDTEIAKAIVAMAHSLNLVVVAEGIEDEAQLKFLRSIKCDKGQGYYFSKPVPEDQFLELLQSKSVLTDTAASDIKRSRSTQMVAKQNLG